MVKAGIRCEDRYAMERRVSIIPKHVKKLIEEGINVSVYPSSKRVFPDIEYQNAGAQLTEDLSDCDVIFGVKEVPINAFVPNKTYVFFSHTIKGQVYNMPSLKKMMELKCTLIDYERITEKGRRLIFFGKYAGLAGMINSLWSMGLKLKDEGFDTPFLKLKQAHKYSSLEEAKQAISQVGQDIADYGLPREVTPLTVGFAGYGNVSVGAQEIFSLLPVKEISPEELEALSKRENLPLNIIYKVVFHEKHLVKPKDYDASFELYDYYNFPEKYESIFDQYIPKLSMLVNCIFWTEKYPRLITKKTINELWSKNKKLKVVGDISCDINGSVEITEKATEIENPLFIYAPETGKISEGYSGDGILVMSVDILPSELPKESSETFSNALMPFLKEIMIADYSADFDNLNLPEPILNAVILHKGELTPDFKYMEKFL